MNWSILPSVWACLSVVIVRFYHMGPRMSRDRTAAAREATREWIAGLVVVAATVVAFVGFAHASLWWTIAISTLVWIGLILFLWSVGRKQRSGRERHPRT